MGQNDKLAKNLKDCSSEAFKKLLQSFRKRTEDFVSLLKDEEASLGDTITQHRETSVPFHKIIVGHIENDLQKARVEQHRDELQMISTEAEALNRVCNESSLLGSAKKI